MDVEFELGSVGQKDIAFDEFWAAYPRKQDKKKARAKWGRLSLSVKQTILDDIQTRFQGIEKRFIPMPTTYINGERWEDEIIKPEDRNGTNQQDTRSRAKRVSDELDRIAAESLAREKAAT